VPQRVPCGQAAAPLCHGECPEGEECIASAAGPCFCSPPIETCGDFQAPACNGFCKDGHVCRPDLLGIGCECLPIGRECDMSPAPVCGGFCPPGEQCQQPTQPGAVGCECAACPSVVPTPVGTILWVDPRVFAWRPHPCADFYNVYRLRTQRMTDADGDGLADDYGSCLMPDLMATQFEHPPVPILPVGFFDVIYVTAENRNGEGPMGMNSAMMMIPNRMPCP
jgi:hypothetical protein